MAVSDVVVSSEVLLVSEVVVSELLSAEVVVLETTGSDEVVVGVGSSPVVDASTGDTILDTLVSEVVVSDRVLD